MKRCPTCDRTFADGMKFCQTDGTLLVDDAPPADPYKTVIGNQSDIASSIPPLDPFKTMVASPPKAEEDVLQLPEEPDSMKTLVVSQDELQNQTKANEAKDVPKLDSPPTPVGGAVPIIEPKVGTPSDLSAAPPKPSEPSLNPPSFGDLSPSEPSLPKPSKPISSDAGANVNPGVPQENPPSPFESTPFQNDFSGQSPYGNQENKPIPSPFDGSMVGYQAPSEPSSFDMPKPPLVKEVEPPYNNQPQSSVQSPFEPPSPFGSAAPYDQPMQQTEWTPPPAPVSEWQNQNIGANTPFQPPPAGQDQTLAIVSLVCGILSILCCGLLTGIPAIITGYMAKNNVDSNPSQYSGRGMALTGMILGGVSVVLSIVIIILQILFGVLGTM